MNVTAGVALRIHVRGCEGICVIYNAILNGIDGECSLIGDNGQRIASIAVRSIHSEADGLAAKREGNCAAFAMGINGKGVCNSLFAFAVLTAGIQLRFVNCDTREFRARLDGFAIRIRIWVFIARGRLWLLNNAGYVISGRRGLAAIIICAILTKIITIVIRTRNPAAVIPFKCPVAVIIKTG